MKIISRLFTIVLYSFTHYAMTILTRYRNQFNLHGEIINLSNSFHFVNIRALSYQDDHFPTFCSTSRNNSFLCRNILRDHLIDDQLNCHRVVLSMRFFHSIVRAFCYSNAPRGKTTAIRMYTRTRCTARPSSDGVDRWVPRRAEITMTRWYA